MKKGYLLLILLALLAILMLCRCQQNPQVGDKKQAVLKEIFQDDENDYRATLEDQSGNVFHADFPVLKEGVCLPKKGETLNLSYKKYWGLHAGVWVVDLHSNPDAESSK